MLVKRLVEEHDLSRFSCGVKPLDDWLQGHSLENQRRNLSRTFVLLDDVGEVIGYYALSMGGMAKEELPRHLGRGLPGYEIGMVLLARLAVTGNYQGKGFGRDLLIDAIIQAAAAGERAAARFIAVDPIDQSAQRFYRKFGFVDIGGDDLGRMFMRMDKAIATFSAVDNT